MLSSANKIVKVQTGEIIRSLYAVPRMLQHHIIISYLFWTWGLPVEYKGFNLISLGDEPLLGDGYARVFLLHHVHATAWHTRLVSC